MLCLAIKCLFVVRTFPVNYLEVFQNIQNSMQLIQDTSVIFMDQLQMLRVLSTRRECSRLKQNFILFLHKKLNIYWPTAIQNITKDSYFDS
jgi:hypothetical protein